MMKFSWKRTFFTAAACFLIGTSVWAAAPADTYKEAVNNMINHPQGEYTVQVQAKMPVVGEGNAKAVWDIQAEPFAGKVAFSASALGQSTPTVQGYIEQDGKKLVYYYDGQYAKLDDSKNNKNTWVKNTIDLKSAEPVAKQIAGVHNVLSGVKDVAANGDTYTVTYDMSQLYTAGDEKEWVKHGAKDSDAKILKDVLLALQQAGDVKATVTIDSDAKRITKIDIPLTDHIRSLTAAIMNNSSSALKDREDVLKFINVSEVSLSIECTALPQGMDVSVPKDVKKHAKEYK